MDAAKIVWLASYPKSGNTWVRLLLGNLLGLNDEDDEDAFAPVAGITSSRGMFEYLLAMDTYELTDAEIDRMRPDVYRQMAGELEEFKFIKAHDCYGRLPNGAPFFPGDCSIGAVYLVRDPLDVAVSYAHHQGQESFEKTVVAMNNPRKYIAGNNREQLKQVMRDWSSHYRSWTEQTEMPVCVVRYEDLRADTVAALKRIVDFVGLDDSRFVVSIEDAVEASRFDRLQKIEQEKGFSERPAKAQKFFRSGRSGEGKERLSSELQKELIAHHGDVMRELGYLEGESA